jgi:hypothetical protein
MKIKIYAGLSIPKNQVRRILPHAVVCGPVRRGDILRDIADGFHVIGIIDGVFFQELAVSPSEILDALRFGIKVFGSSSIGALRAVELAPQGMVGVGEVYRYIDRAGIFLDDWLGQTFSEQKEEEPLSAAKIDFVLELDRLLEKKKIRPDAYARVLRELRKTHFSDWNARAFQENISKRWPGSIPRFKSGRAKRGDAVALLREIARHSNSVKQFYKPTVSTRKPPRLRR